MNESNNVSNIYLFAPIDEWTRDSLMRILENTQGEANIMIESYGGNVFDGLALASLIARRPQTNTTVLGVAASIASIIAISGEVVAMDENSFMMIHNAWTFTAGEAEDLRKDADLLDKISDQLAEAYTNKIMSNKAGDREKTKMQVVEMMKEETWLNANEALNLGLIDKIVSMAGADKEAMEVVKGGERKTDDEGIRAKFQNNLRKFKNLPKKVLYNYSKQSTEMEDKKTLLQKFAEFLGFKASVEAIEAPIEEKATEEQAEAQETKADAQNDDTMTVEQAKELLEKEGYTVENAQPETKEEVAPQDSAEDKIKALEAKIKKLELKAASKSSASMPTEKEEKKEGLDGLKTEQIAVFDNLLAAGKGKYF